METERAAFVGLMLLVGTLAGIVGGFIVAPWLGFFVVAVAATAWALLAALGSAASRRR